LEGQVISYGSCQFPTLGFVVERYRNVKDFIPEQFWKISGEFRVINELAKKFLCEWLDFHLEFHLLLLSGATAQQGRRHGI